MTPGRRLVTIAAALAAVIACAALPAGASAASPVVTATTGRLQGVLTAHAREFLGVRYARPPVGQLRFAPPQPLPRSDRLVRADKPGARCAQTGGEGVGAASLSEDCLFLNVTTPRGMRSAARLPVMLFIHGGGYTSGAGSDYSADRLARQGHVIVVTINYRLGVFGYLGLPGLKGGGDFGLLDAIAALRWTKANAAAFGGDPDNITVFGQSAGAMESCALLTSPVARGLIDKVGSQSGGSCMLNWPDGGLLYKAPAQTPYTSLAANHALSEATARTLHCRSRGTLACLRRLPVRELRRASADFSDQLAYGTPVLPQNPATAVRDGHYLHIPVLTGTNLHEEFSFVGGVQQAMPGAYTPQTYPTLLHAAFGANAGTVGARYPLTAYPSAGAAFASVITDDSWACPTLLGSRLLARRTRVYEYEFNDPHSPDVSQVHAPGISQGSAHATELPYLFDLGGRNLLTTAASRRLSRAMIAYWTSFARTGRPTAPGQPAWGPQAPTGHKVLGLDASGIQPVDLSSEHQCDFWQTINPKETAHEPHRHRQPLP